MNYTYTSCVAYCVLFTTLPLTTSIVPKPLDSQHILTIVALLAYFCSQHPSTAWQLYCTVITSCRSRRAPQGQHVTTARASQRHSSACRRKRQVTFAHHTATAGIVATPVAGYD